MRLTSAALAATVALAAPAAGRPLYRSPDGNTVTIELFNRGAATWAAGRSGSSGARTAYTAAVSLSPSSRIRRPKAVFLATGTRYQFDITGRYFAAKLKTTVVKTYPIPMP